MKLSIFNNVTKKEYEFSVEDIGDSVLLYHFNITLESNMDDGEYSYRLLDEDDKVVANGLLQIGDYTIPSGSTTTYNNNTEYIQYNG